MDQTETNIVPAQVNVTNVFKKVDSVIVTNSIELSELQQKKKECRVHREQALDFLCVACDDEICQLCKLSEHEGHETRSVSLVAEEVGKSLMSVCAGRLKDFKQEIVQILQRIEQQLQLLEQDKQGVKDVFNKRFARLKTQIGIESPGTLAVLVKAFDERLRSGIRNKLKQGKGKAHKNKVYPRAEVTEAAVCLRRKELKDMLETTHRNNLLQVEDSEKDASTYLSSCKSALEMELTALSTLEEEVKEAIEQEDHWTVHRLKRSVANDFSKERMRQKLRTASPAHSYMLRHIAPRTNERKAISDIFWSDRKDDIEKIIQNFFGTVEKTEIPLEKAAVDIQARLAFRCCKEDDATVRFICPLGNDQLAMSFTTGNSSNTTASTKYFTASGGVLEKKPFGLASLALLPTRASPKGKPFCLQLPKDSGETTRLFAKTNKHYAVESKAGSPSLAFHRVCCEQNDDVSFVQLGSHHIVQNGDDIEAVLAFDASNTGKTFAVVVTIKQKKYNSHGFLDAIQYVRQVLVFDRKQDHDPLTMSIYKPSTPKCYPSDVCFYDQNGNEVLLIADMEDSSVHLAKRTAADGQVFAFEGYLMEEGDGLSTLKCPTALNIDTKGRLLVAGKGGYLFVVERAE